MEEARGTNCNSHIAGQSVHNCGIEHYWRDVYTSVTTSYVVVFTLLEQVLLDLENETDLFCLHYIFIPRINHSLNLFMQSWNNNSLLSECNRYPAAVHRWFHW
uniref:Integrase core domain-containing protein n=1 Tax=Amphimedon queenslandica TaxID=400682 RepID=A0A1X7U7R2_AMPQE